MREVEAVALTIGTWFVGSFARFLEAEAPALMAKTDRGEFKFSAIERFREILHQTVKRSIRNNSPIPHWRNRRCSRGGTCPAFNSPTVNRLPLQRVRTSRRSGPVEIAELPERQRARTMPLEVPYQVLIG
jgi:hypothetical protein